MRHFLKLIKSALQPSIVSNEEKGAVEYPSRPIRMIIPFAAGGPADILGRILSAKLQESWAQPVNLEIRHGVNGIVGSDIVAKAAPDGYTLAVAASAHYINPGIYKSLPFDSIKDFAPVSLVAGGPNILVVHPSVPATTLAAFIAYAKANPGKLKYASGGHGSPSHLAGELFNIIAGVNIKHVPYKGHAAAGAALSEGREVQLMYDAIFTCIGHIKKGEWRALAVTTPRRAAILPDLPTMAEGGLAGYEVSPAMGVLAPAGTPRHVIDKLSNEISRIVNLPDVAAQIRSDGAEPIGSSSGDYGKYMESEVSKWSGISKRAGIEPQDYSG